MSKVEKEQPEELNSPRAISEFFREGVQAYKAGKEMDDCPYLPKDAGGDGTISRTDWLSGFLAAWRITKHGPLVYQSEDGKEAIDETVFASKLGLAQGQKHKRKSTRIRMARL